jgi:hypothetical protein
MKKEKGRCEGNEERKKVGVKEMKKEKGRCEGNKNRKKGKEWWR